MKRILLSLIISCTLSACLPSTASFTNGSSSRSRSQEFFNNGVALLTKDDNFAGAAQMFDKAVSADPTFLRALRAAAWSYFHLGNKEKEKKQDYFRTSEQYAEKLIPLDKETADGYYILAMINYFNDPSLAIKNFKHVIDTPPNPTESLAINNKFQQAGVYLSIAYAYGAIKDYANCLIYINKYLSSCQNNSQCSQGVADAKDIARKIENYIACKKRQETLMTSQNIQKNTIALPSKTQQTDIKDNAKKYHTTKKYPTQQNTEKQKEITPLTPGKQPPERLSIPTKQTENTGGVIKSDDSNQTTILAAHTNKELRLATQELELAQDELDKALEPTRGELIAQHMLNRW